MIPAGISAEAILATFAKLVASHVVAELNNGRSSTEAPAAREWLTTDEATSELKISRAKLLRLRDDGCPVHYCGQSPRWVMGEVRDWLDERGKRGAASKPSSDGIVLKKKRGGR